MPTAGCSAIYIEVSGFGAPRVIEPQPTAQTIIGGLLRSLIGSIAWKLRSAMAKKESIVEINLELNACPFATCSGYINFDLAHECEQRVSWEGECTKCKRVFKLNYEKWMGDLEAGDQ